MPKVVGPLFSLSASGTFRDALEFRTVGDETRVAGRRTAPRTRTPAQRAQAQRFGAAVAAWKLIAPAARAQWASASASTGKSGYQLYLSEYQRQGIAAPDQPALP